MTSAAQMEIFKHAIRNEDEERLGEIVREVTADSGVLQEMVERMPMNSVVPFLELVSRSLDSPAMSEWVISIVRIVYR